MSFEAKTIMPKASRRAKAYIDTLLGTKQLTPAGLSWLTAATDPFHDNKLPELRGYPDMNTAQTVLQCFQETIAVQKPSTVTTGNWDCHIPFLPVTWGWDQQSTTTPSALNSIAVTARGQVGTTTIDRVNLYSGYNIITCATGFDWYGDTADNFNTDYRVGYPAKGSTGNYRLVAAGLEVHNVTADLYKGGSVTCYRGASQPQQTFFKYLQALPATIKETPYVRQNSKNQLVIPRADFPGDVESVAGSVIRTLPYQSIQTPPSTIKQAHLYQNTRTWAAEQGVYTIATQSSETNPFISARPGNVAVFRPFDASFLTTTVSVAPAWVSTNGFETLNDGHCFALPFETSGAIFTNLNANSALQVTVRYYVERIPSVLEEDVLQMAAGPAEYDPLALEIYSRAVTDLPVGVPVGENPLGEWFSDVLDSIMAMGPKIGRIVSNVGKGITIASSPDDESKVNPQRVNTMTNKQKQQQKQSFRGKSQKGKSQKKTDFKLSNKQ